MTDLRSVAIHAVSAPSDRTSHGLRDPSSHTFRTVIWFEPLIRDVEPADAGDRRTKLEFTPDAN